MSFGKNLLEVLCTTDSKISLTVKIENIKDIKKANILSEYEKRQVLNFFEDKNLKPNNFLILQDSNTKEVKLIVLINCKNNDILIFEIFFENKELKYETYKTIKKNIDYTKNINGKIEKFNLEINFNMLFIAIKENQLERALFLKEVNYIIKNGTLVKKDLSSINYLILQPDGKILSKNFFTGEITKIENIKEKLTKEMENKEKLVSKLTSKNVMWFETEDEKYSIKN